MEPHSLRITLEFDQVNAPHVHSALTRLGYLHPTWHLQISDITLVVTAPTVDSPEAVLREIRYTLYREKILAETMSMRRELLRMVARP